MGADLNPSETPEGLQAQLRAAAGVRVPVDGEVAPPRTPAIAKMRLYWRKELDELPPATFIDRGRFVEWDGVVPVEYVWQLIRDAIDDAYDAGRARA